MDTDIKVGDTVTWRAGGKPSKGTGSMPIGIANCQVLEIGEAEGGKPAAMIKLPHPMGPQPVGAILADLYVDD